MTQQVQGRQMGWVNKPATEYVRSVRRIAVRCRKQDGQWGIGVLIWTLTEAQMVSLTRQEAAGPTIRRRCCGLGSGFMMSVAVGVETSFKGDKQGLGIGKRSKKRFEAQQMVMLLGSLAHNVVVWSRAWLAASASPLRQVWDAAHDPRCVSCQWVSRHGCEGSAGCSDCAQPGCSFGLLPWLIPCTVCWLLLRLLLS